MSSRPLLTGHQEYVEDNHSELIEENRRLRIQVRQLDEALRLERLKEEAVSAGVKELRKILNPLYKALGAVFGEIDAMGISESSKPSSSGSPMAEAWQRWIQKLGGHRGSFIQALLDHGPSTASQLSVAMGVSRMTTIYDTANALSKLGLITKNGNQYVLKQ
jgi:hypothetical protein